jgi:phenylacetic acid degradation operon negative regulatory protein
MRTAMQARSALFDLYGDHLRHRGGVAPIAALVRLLSPLDIAAPAVRTAVSRMVRQGWLRAVDVDAGRAYGLSDRATRRLDEAAARIYRHRPVEAWDSCWSIAITSHSADRTTRERLHRAMEYLGYRQLQTDAWIAPRPAPELESVVEAEGLTVTAFHGEHVGDQETMVRRLFRPVELAAAYRSWLVNARTLIGRADASDPEAAFAARSRLLHEWRKFLFRDPGLPIELLPDDWPGADAAAYFDAESARLLPAATKFVDSCLDRRDP